MKRSLGLLEVEGFVAATSSIDAMIKHAFIEVVQIEKAGSGWVTIFVQGDLASVQAALEMGAEIASKYGQVIGLKVIPRPDEKLYGKLIPSSRVGEPS